jgi:hypothetical protein
LKLSRRTLARMMEFLEHLNKTFESWERRRAERERRRYWEGEATSKFWSRLLFEHEFPEEVVQHAEKHYKFDWDRIVRSLDTGEFFFTEWGPIVPEMPQKDAEILGPVILTGIAAILAADALGPEGPVKGSLKNRIDPLIRSIEHDGFSVDAKNLKLIPLEGPISHEEEESRLAQLISTSRLQNAQVIKTHLEAAVENYVSGTQATDHASLGESRTLFQAVVDGISEGIDKSGKATVGLPGGTANRFEYLEKNGLVASDERTMLGSGWGFLSAGNHPGLPSRELARMGLLFSLELSQMLIMKWLHWKEQNRL